MSFDGLGDVFGPTGVEPILLKVEGRQCPDGGYGRCSMDGAVDSVSETYYSCRLPVRALWHTLFHLLAVGKSGCDMLGAFTLELVVADIQ